MKNIRAGRVIRFLVAAILSAAVATAGEPPVPPAEELGKLLTIYAEYEGLSPAEKTRTKRPDFNYPPLSKAGAEAWSKDLWQAWIERLKTTRSEKTSEKLAFPAAWQKAGNVFLGIVQTDFREKPDTQVKVAMRFGAMTIGEKPEKG